MIHIRSSPSGPLFITSDALGLVGRHFYNTPGTFQHVCQDQTTFARVRAAGGGGAGGGAKGNAGQGSVGAPASGAGVFDALIELVAGKTLTFTIGAGGLGVLGGTGNNGTPTTFSYNGVLFTANPGLGSIATGSAITLFFLGCVDGGTATCSNPGADVVLYKGGPGGLGVRESSGTSGAGGNGGASALAPGGTGASSPIGGNLSADGFPGQYGSGGGGAVNFNGSPAAGNKGGQGGDGVFWIEELGL